jgi:DNA repair protein RecN (Recombination protein N)
MLAKLSVRNYALIRELDLELDNGLTIITGETGSGKTILLGALSLILGARADTSVLLDSDSKCIVEGTFRIAEYNLQGFFDDNNLDYDDSTVIRREINPAGKTRAFVNDTPVTVSLLKDLGNRLIDIHSQHQNLMLNENSFQLSIIDSFAGTLELLKEYRALYDDFRKLGNELSALRSQADRNKADMEYYRHQLDQLEEARLKENEQEELEKEQEMLDHADEIKSALAGASSLLSANDISVLSMLREAKSNMEKISVYLTDAGDLKARLESAYIELDDIAGEVEKLAFNTDTDPEKLAWINNRLDQIYSLMHKHRVSNLAELLVRKDEIRKKLLSINANETRLEEVETALKIKTELLSAQSVKISEKRRAVVPETEKKVMELLHKLGMPNARFRIRLTPADDFTVAGKDIADFLFSANKQTEPEDIARIASGGELSRVMLSLKSLIAQNNNLPSIIFDEIDSGVSGEVADRVGQILSSMGKCMQVINITHLPQVASRGSRHFHIYKEDRGDSTITRVKLLSPDERIIEVARLLSGSEVTDTAIKNAKELIRSAAN